MAVQMEQEIKAAPAAARMRIAFPRVTWPFAALLRRELLTLLRRTSTYVMLFLFVGAATALVANELPNTWELEFRAASYSREMLFYSTLLLVTAVCLFLPTLGATSITVEREQDTLDMLKTTMVTRTGLVMSKIIITCAFFFLLFAGSLPVLATPIFLAGLDLSVVLYTLAIVATMAITASVAGVMTSSLYQRTIVAVPLAFAPTAIMFCGGLLFLVPVVLLFGRISSMSIMLQARYSYSAIGRDSLVDWLAMTSPFGALYALNELPSFGMRRMLVLVLYQGVGTAIMFQIALRRLYRSPKAKRYEKVKPIDDTAILAKRKKTFPYYLIDPLARKKPIEDGRNPMLVREVRWGAFNRGTRNVRVFYFAFALFLVPALDAYVSDNIAPGVLFLQQCMMILLAPTVVANTLTKEYEMGNMDMLRMSLLTPYEIIMGKLVAGLSALAPIYAAVIAATLVPLVYVPTSVTMVLHSILNLTLVTLITLSFGMFSSLISQRTGRALVLSYVLTFAFFVLPAMTYDRQVQFPDRIQGDLILSGLDQLAFATIQSPPAWFILFWQQRPVTGAPTPFYDLVCWLAHVSVYCILVAAVLRLCVWNFAKRKMRDA
jgi:ABC-type transport system involved in multi-copper enzyme maturation permease subunit